MSYPLWGKLLIGGTTLFAGSMGYLKSRDQPLLLKVFAITLPSVFTLATGIFSPFAAIPFAISTIALPDWSMNPE